MDKQGNRGLEFLKKSIYYLKENFLYTEQHTGLPPELPVRDNLW